MLLYRRVNISQRVTSETGKKLTAVGLWYRRLCYGRDAALLGGCYASRSLLPFPLLCIELGWSCSGCSLNAQRLFPLCSLLPRHRRQCARPWKPARDLHTHSFSLSLELAMPFEEAESQHCQSRPCYSHDWLEYRANLSDHFCMHMHVQRRSIPTCRDASGPVPRATFRLSLF